MHKKVAQAVEMKSNNIKKVLITCGVDAGRGCTGDVKHMFLDMARSNLKNENPNPKNC